MSIAASCTSLPNKLPDALENPIDAFILHLIRPMLPLLRATGHTPNVITTYSFLCGLGAVWMLHSGLIAPFVVLFAASYVLDCVDGQFARQYGLTTRFGAYYDSVTDVLVQIAVAFLIWKRFQKTPGFRLIVGLLLVTLALTWVHLGNQEISYTQKCDTTPSDTFAPMARVAKFVKMDIRLSRWFGCGTFYLLVILAVVFLEHRRKSALKDPSRGE